MSCSHTNQIQQVTPASSGCRLCLESGDTWVQLRMCLSCGQVSCCDASKNQHAMKHAKISGHAIVQSFELGEDWRWCYIDEEFVDAAPSQTGVAPAEELPPKKQAFD